MSSPMSAGLAKADELYIVMVAAGLTLCVAPVHAGFD